MPRAVPVGRLAWPFDFEPREGSGSRSLSQFPFCSRPEPIPNPVRQPQLGIAGSLLEFGALALVGSERKDCLAIFRLFDRPSKWIYHGCNCITKTEEIKRFWP